MIILIDAYNMMKQVLHEKHISDMKRQQFVSMLGCYANKKKHTLIIVFDGGPYQWVHTDKISRVEVVYSGAHASADEYIKQYLQEHRYADILLVSTDNELVMFASTLAIPSIAALDFYLLIKNTVDNNGTIKRKESAFLIKSASDTPEHIDILMEHASQVVPSKLEDSAIEVRRQVAHGHKGSKAEKKLLQILKKL